LDPIRSEPGHSVHDRSEHLKTGEFEAEIEEDEREVFELLREQALVPFGIFGELMSAILKARTCAGVPSGLVF
jgi:hypothetical protein